jgi:hypothetical protein
VVNDAKGGTVYRDHLPLLGEQGPGRTGLHGFAVGDQVMSISRPPIYNAFNINSTFTRSTST